MAKPKKKLQRIPFTVTTAGQVIPIDAETDKLYNTCTGVDILLSDDNARFSTLQLDINSTEVFPENCEVIRIKFKEQAPAEYDYYPLTEPAGGSKIKGTYTDSNVTGVPYNVTLTFHLENISPSDTGKID